jgi:hypothetical protein
LLVRRRPLSEVTAHRIDSDGSLIAHRGTPSPEPPDIRLR